MDKLMEKVNNYLTDIDFVNILDSFAISMLLLVVMVWVVIRQQG